MVIACCSVDYSGRLDDHLPEATRLITVKADGCARSSVRRLNAAKTDSPGEEALPTETGRVDRVGAVTAESER